MEQQQQQRTRPRSLLLRRWTRKHNLASPIIVDFQCFKNNKNEFILKEVCVLDVNTGTLLMHHVAKPPYSQSELSDEKLRESHWLTKHCHGMTWEQGDIPFNSLLYKLTDCITNRPTVYVKGFEKKEYLKRQHVMDFVTTNVIDVGDIGCGSIDSINNLLSTNILRCNSHNFASSRCALSNCVAIRGWLHLTATRPEENNYGENSNSGSCLCSCIGSSDFSTTTTVADGYDTVE